MPPKASLAQSPITTESAADIEALRQQVLSNARSIYPSHNQLDLITTIYSLPNPDGSSSEHFQAVLITHLDADSYQAVRSASAKSVSEAMRKMWRGLQKEVGAKQVMPGTIVRKEGSATGVDV